MGHPELKHVDNLVNYLAMCTICCKCFIIIIIIIIIITSAIPKCLYSCENCVLKKQDEQRIQTTEIRATANVRDVYINKKLRYKQTIKCN